MDNIIHVDDDAVVKDNAVKEAGAAVVKTDEAGRVRFAHAFVASLSVILVSEIGDKTFFIAAIMAMRHPRVTIFAGAISALATMTVMSGWWSVDQVCEVCVECRPGV